MYLNLGYGSILNELEVSRNTNTKLLDQTAYLQKKIEDFTKLLSEKGLTFEEATATITVVKGDATVNEGVAASATNAAAENHHTFSASAPSSRPGVCRKELKNFLKMVQGVMGSDPTLQTECTKQIRGLIDRYTQPVINSSLVKHCLQFLQRDNNLALQYEAAWTLSFIVIESWEHVSLLVFASSF